MEEVINFLLRVLESPVPFASLFSDLIAPLCLCDCVDKVDLSNKIKFESDGGCSMRIDGSELS